MTSFFSQLLPRKYLLIACFQYVLSLLQFISRQGPFSLPANHPFSPGRPSLSLPGLAAASPVKSLLTAKPNYLTGLPRGITPPQKISLQINLRHASIPHLTFPSFAFYHTDHFSYTPKTSHSFFTFIACILAPSNHTPGNSFCSFLIGCSEVFFSRRM